MDEGGIKFNCLQCQQHLEAPHGMIGDVIECPSCKTMIVVPSEECGLISDSKIDVPDVVQQNSYKIINKGIMKNVLIALAVTICFSWMCWASTVLLSIKNTLTSAAGCIYRVDSSFESVSSEIRQLDKRIQCFDERFSSISDSCSGIKPTIDSMRSDISNIRRVVGEEDPLFYQFRVGHVPNIKEDLSSMKVDISSMKSDISSISSDVRSIKWK